MGEPQINTSLLLSYLRNKWMGRPCLMCSAGTWNIQDKIYQLLEFQPGVGLAVGGPIVPVIPVVCSNCGNTVLINAVVAGVLKPEPPKPEGQR